MPKTKTISILFSTYTDVASKVVYLLSNRGYTHVSIALDSNFEYFYAFNTKGFRREYPKKHKNRTKNNICVKLEVSKKQYTKLENILKEFKRKESTYSYNWLGLIFCLFKLKLPRKNKFFCSQFVAKLLEKAGIIKLKKDSGKYLPNNLMKEIMLSPLVKSTVVNCFAT